MHAVRLVIENSSLPLSPCSRCGAKGCHWDRVADQTLCPDCQEALIRGEGEPLVQPTQPRPCVVCGRRGSVVFRSFPLHEPGPIEFDICPRHLRELLARRLRPRSFQRLRRQLNLAGFAVEQLFLLHESFYTEEGQALRPVIVD